MNRKDHRDDFFSWAANLLYLLIGLAMIIMAGIAVWISLRDIYTAIRMGKSYTMNLLNSVGLIVLALAIFDVGKYLIEEEVLRTRELRETSEARQSLTKFIAIMLIALGLETLVFVFKAGHTDMRSPVPDMRNLLYPGALIVAIAVLLLALGWYQRLSIRAEVSEKGELSRAKKGQLPSKAMDDEKADEDT